MRTVMVAVILGALVAAGKIPWEPGLAALLAVAVPDAYRKMRGKR